MAIFYKPLIIDIFIQRKDYINTSLAITIFGAGPRITERRSGPAPRRARAAAIFTGRRGRRPAHSRRHSIWKNNTLPNPDLYWDIPG